MSEVAYDDNIIAIEELEGHHYVVEEYQRGYKWGIQQIRELLTDIQDFDRAGIESFYCLQPIVVKNIPDGKFELIDGQQRLTTIFIILQCLKAKVYDISYQTRDSSRGFLKKIASLELVTDLDVNTDVDKVIVPKLHNAWNTYLSIEGNEQYNNVDNFHFYCGYQYIKNWLNTFSDKETNLFKDNLLRYTKVIWHEQSGSDPAEQVFIKFNQGKIELAQAELIKALFVLQLKEEKNAELRSFRLNQFAEEWSFIENQLQDDSFWFFVSNDVSDNKKSNRIDLLFDLIFEVPEGTNNKLYSYHRYLEIYTERKKDNSVAELDWTKVNDLFNQLFEWYHDRELYHLIGFIIYEDIQSIADINRLYQKITSKTGFRQKLRALIHEYLFGKKNKDKFNLDAMVYGTNNRAISAILVLHNVINYFHTDSYYRFPFDRLKLEDGWSLEHIHAQNTDKFEQIEQIKDWLEDLDNLKEDFKQEEKWQATNTDGLDQAIKAVREKLEETNISPSDKDLKRLVEVLDEAATSFFNKDSLSNLCLLDRKTNSSIGKKFFKEKRKEILAIDKMTLAEYNTDHKQIKPKPFIPLATKHVFLKYFTEGEAVQMTFWGAQDRRYYQEHIKTGIKKFLKKEVKE
jgi:uncharacterized protein with ParB-like and HNH nuclease domain